MLSAKVSLLFVDNVLKKLLVCTGAGLFCITVFSRFVRVIFTEALLGCECIKLSRNASSTP